MWSSVRTTGADPARAARIGARILASAASVTIVAAGLVACSGGDQKPAEEEGGVATVRVATLPIVDAAPLYLGIEKGFFADEDIEIEPQILGSGAEVVTSVISGESDFGTGNTISALAAAAKSLPLKLVSPNMTEAEDGGAYSPLLVKKDSPIQGIADLEGKTIAVNTLQNIGTLTINTALEKAGVDPSSVQFLEVPFPDMGAALESDRVDAIWTVEPFGTINMENTRIVSEPLKETMPGLLIGLWFTTDEFLEKNPEVAKRFLSALNKAKAYANDHPDEARSIVTTYTTISPEVAEKMVLGHFPEKFDRASLELLGELAVRDGIIDAQPDYDKILLSQ